MKVPYVSKGCIGSDKAQGVAFREAADSFRIKSMSIKQGKGARWRTLPNDRFRSEFDRIFRT